MAAAERAAGKFIAITALGLGLLKVYRLLASGALTLDLGAYGTTSGSSTVGRISGRPGRSFEDPGSGGGGAESDPITAGDCTYRQAVDDPHISSTGPAATSVHGWWLYASGTCPSQAHVTVYLQAYRCEWWGCFWETEASGSADVYAGGGSQIATARRECSATDHAVGWRGGVDVDLIGISDPGGITYGPSVTVYCTP